MCTPADPRGNVSPFQQMLAPKFQAAGMNVPAGTRGMPLLAAMVALAAKNKGGLGNTGGGSAATQAQKPALGTPSGTLGV